MTSNEKLWDICLDIYRDLFRMSKPPANFDELMKNGETTKPEWFYKYHLDLQTQIEIIDKHLAKNKIKRRDAQRISITIHLGSSPCSCEGKNPGHKLEE